MGRSKAEYLGEQAREGTKVEYRVRLSWQTGQGMGWDGAEKTYA